MANTKISQLTTWTGDTTGFYVVADNSGLTQTYKVSKETLLGEFTGSWTVTPGTNNYSFTLDTNSTYNLWVLGNIPNGLIVYNATVTISNSNVPVIGVQYAWNFTGGGSPISLTSIPVQIIGSAGTIVITNPPVGTSTNTFVFGIQNNTGSNVTVNYGYLKIG